MKLCLIYIYHTQWLLNETGCLELWCPWCLEYFNIPIHLTLIYRQCKMNWPCKETYKCHIHLDKCCKTHKMFTVINCDQNPFFKIIKHNTAIIWVRFFVLYISCRQRKYFLSIPQLLTQGPTSTQSGLCELFNRFNYLFFICQLQCINSHLLPRLQEPSQHLWHHIVNKWHTRKHTHKLLWTRNTKFAQTLLNV